MPLPLRILYVEDNDMVREITLELLESDQRRIVGLATAEDALREFKQQTFDLVITDVSLPAMSGLDLARTIQGIQPGMPIILATGYAMDLRHGSWASNVRALVKPFDGAQIEGLIAELCAG